MLNMVRHPSQTFFENAILARKFARAGIEIFPCKSQGKNAKAPYLKKGFRAASADIRQIERWWDQWPDALIGLVPGQESIDAIVLDLDRKPGKDGVAAFRKLCPEWEDYPATITPSGGEHIWFARPKGGHGNEIGDLPKGIDVRCDNGYVCFGRLTNGSHYDADPIIDYILNGIGWPELPPVLVTAIRAGKKNRVKEAENYFRSGRLLVEPDAVKIDWKGYDSDDASDVFASLFEVTLNAILDVTQTTLSDHSQEDLCLTVHEALTAFLEAANDADSELAAAHMQRRGSYSIRKLMARRTAEDPGRGPETVRRERAITSISTAIAKAPQEEIATDTHNWVKVQLRDLALSEVEKADPLEFDKLLEQIGNKAHGAGLDLARKLPGQRKTLLFKAYEAERDAVARENAKRRTDSSRLHFPHLDGREDLPRKDSLSNALYWLSANGIALRYNEWTDEIELDKKPVTDTSAGALRVAMHDDEFFASDALVDKAIRHAAAEAPFHPVKRYLERQADKWDGVNRIDSWLIDYCGAPDNKHWRAISRLIFTAIVMRVYRPGAKFDLILTLLGPEGTGKSSLCRTLAIRDEWHLEGFQLGWSAKQILENTTGQLICEYAELAGHTQKEQGALKDAATRQKDKERKAYDRHSTVRKRQFIVIANANELEVLVSKHGNRRFIPLTISEHIDIDGLDAALDQLYAEAVHAQREHLATHGEAVLLPKEHWEYFGILQEEYRYKSSIEDRTTRLMDSFSVGYVAVTDIYDALELRHNNPHGARDVEHALMLMGWKKTRERLGGDVHKQRYFIRGDDYANIRIRPVTVEGRVVGFTDKEPL